MLLACAPELPLDSAEPHWDAPEAPQGSQSVVMSADGAAIYSLLPDEGLVCRFDRESDEVDCLDLGGNPSRIALFGDRVLVSLRAARALAVLEDQGGGLVEVDRVATGSEPMGLAVREDDQRVYVALHTEGVVQEFDGELNLIRALPVEGRPSWLALHPAGHSLYVVSAVGGALTWFDLDADEAQGVRFLSPTLRGAGPGGNLDFTGRFTGDPALRPDSGELAVPALWVDNTSPPKHTLEEQAERDPAEAYARMGLGLTPTNPGIVLWGLDPVSGEPQAESLRARTATVEASPVEPGVVQVVRSYLSALTWSPDGEAIAATMPGSRLVMILVADRALDREGLGGFVEGPLATVVTGEGPSGVTWQPSGMWALNALEPSLASLPVEAAREGLASQADGGVFGETRLEAENTISLSAPLFGAELTRGRLLFTTAVMPVMTTPASGVSCATCHFDGRDDGLSWPDYDTIDRQTKSLAGGLSLTAPFTWTEEVPTVAAEVQITSESRLGGRGATQADFDAVAAWIDAIPSPDHPNRGATTEAVARGKALFERADVGCASCHSGARYTDHVAHDLYGLPGVDTPSLVGLAASPPYLHDGSALTIAELLATTRAGEMGDTSMLTAAELGDLEAFLSSL